jgi:hypothetical protein
VCSSSGSPHGYAWQRSVSNIVTIILSKSLHDQDMNFDAVALSARFIHERPLPRSRRDQSSDGHLLLFSITALMSNFSWNVVTDQREEAPFR